MSRLELATTSRARKVLEGLYKDLERRIESSTPGLCPIDMSRTFLEMCYAQTCGKCTPCRIGLGQLLEMMKSVLDGKATLEILDTMEETATDIINTADCAIGYEAAEMVQKGLIGFRHEYVKHIENGRCTCSFSQPVPCVKKCPAEINIPGYIALVKEKRYADAIRLIRKDNPFPTTCAYICEHPCEAYCRRNIIDDSINIRGLKRVASDKAGIVDPPKPNESTGKKVAVIGSGPGGMSSAYYLQLMGHQVTVYEMLNNLGGMLRYGIPNYRLPKNRLDEDMNAILKLGVEVKYNVKIGEDVTLQELRETHDAVLVTIGASTDKKLGLDGEDANGVYSAVEFLRAIGHDKYMNLEGKKVVVIGGGNVSMDAVRTAIRLKAQKVNVVYRRRVKDMTALHAEIEGAIAEGVEISTLKSPKEILVNEKNEVTGLLVTPQMISKIKNGRSSIVDTGEPDEMIPCDILIVATGQDIDYKHFEENGLPIKSGTITTETTADFKNIPGVFAAGDCSSGPSTVINAIAAAKVAAANIDTYLGYHHIIDCDVEIPTPNISDTTPCARVNMTEREAGERILDFDEIEKCMSTKEAQQESDRCLRCDHFGFGIFKGGRSKSW